MCWIIKKKWHLLLFIQYYHNLTMNEASKNKTSTSNEFKNWSSELFIAGKIFIKTMPSYTRIFPKPVVWYQKYAIFHRRIGWQWLFVNRHIPVMRAAFKNLRNGLCWRSISSFSSRAMSFDDSEHVWYPRWTRCINWDECSQKQFSQITKWAILLW